MNLQRSDIVGGNSSGHGGGSNERWKFGGFIGERGGGVEIEIEMMSRKR